LDHHGIARDKLRGSHAGQYRCRKVERSYNTPHAIGLHDALALFVWLGAFHRRLKAVVTLHLLGVVAHKVYRLIHIAYGLVAVLAVLVRDPCGKLELALAHKVCRLSEYLYPLLP